MAFEGKGYSICGIHSAVIKQGCYNPRQEEPGLLNK